MTSEQKAVRDLLKEYQEQTHNNTSLLNARELQDTLYNLLYVLSGVDDDEDDDSDEDDEDFDRVFP